MTKGTRMLIGADAHSRGSAAALSPAAETVLIKEKVIAGEEKGRETGE